MNLRSADYCFDYYHKEPKLPSPLFDINKPIQSRPSQTPGCTDFHLTCTRPDGSMFCIDFTIDNQKALAITEKEVADIAKQIYYNNKIPSQSLIPQNNIVIQNKKIQ